MLLTFFFIFTMASYQNQHLWSLRTNNNKKIHGRLVFATFFQRFLCEHLCLEGKLQKTHLLQMWLHCNDLFSFWTPPPKKNTKTAFFPSIKPKHIQTKIMDDFFFVVAIPVAKVLLWLIRFECALITFPKLPLPSTVKKWKSSTEYFLKRGIDVAGAVIVPDRWNCA